MIRSTATAQQGAIVRLRVSAICLPESRVTVHHNGMLFTARTDAFGTLDIEVPAIAERAVFMLTFAGEQMAMAVTHVPEISDYKRIVLQWQGDGGLELRARGIDKAQETAALGSVDAVGGNQTGRVVRLGNRDTAAPMTADVYSFPLATADNGRLDLSIEVQVTERNCGRQIEAQTLQLGDDRQLNTHVLVLSVPTCDAVGDYLVLNNVLEDLTIAAR